jgi:7-carboxy-7-deazaguanine synthase
VHISEIFYSIQGEGRLLGIPSVFIRTAGCNLRCVWCDTPYTSWRPEGLSWSIKKILQRVGQHPTRYVVITGGEPLLAGDVEELVLELKREGKHITIETAGTIFKPLRCDLVSLSPKLAHSTPWKRARGKFARMHDERRLNIPVLKEYLRDYDYQLKFVVESESDFGEIAELLDRLKTVEPAHVLIMAQGTTRKQVGDKARWIVPLCMRHGYGYTPRLQIELFGNRRGT